MWTLIMKLPHTEVKFYPEVKSQTGLSSLRISCKRALKQILFTLLFIAGKMKCISFQAWSEKNGPLSRPILFVCACTDVSFHMVSFRVVFTLSFITRNEISFLSKWTQWNNTRSEGVVPCFILGCIKNIREQHPWLYHVKSYKKLTRYRN